MRGARTRARSTAEVAFLLMRELANARLLWVRSAALPIDALPGLLSVPPGAISAALERLREEGIVELCRPDATVRFTERAVRDILYAVGSDRAAQQRADP